MTLTNKFVLLIITGLLTLVGNLVGYKINPIDALPGITILVLIAFLGIAIAKLIPLKVPSVAYIIAIATAASIPGGPFAEFITTYTAKVNFLALCTPILAYAGIYTGKNIDSLKKTGWKILILGLFVILGTYLGSAIIAQLILKSIGQI
ncbi:MAG: DUF340 domain-containing protein [Fusobacteriales bacterium]|nr:MAG: DUF340 domain-containing protein [Fusobacteriales bacterium]